MDTAVIVAVAGGLSTAAAVAFHVSDGRRSARAEARRERQDQEVEALRPVQVAQVALDASANAMRAVLEQVPTQIALARAQADEGIAIAQASAEAAHGRAEQLAVELAAERSERLEADVACERRVAKLTARIDELTRG